MNYTIAEKLLAILFSLMIFFNAYILSKHMKTWLSPGSIFCIFWFGYTFLPLVFLFNVPINAYAVFYIMIATVTFTLPSFFLNWKIAFDQNRKKVDLKLYNEFSSVFLLFSFYIIQIIVLSIILFDIFLHGFSLYDVLFNLMQTSSKYISIRYAGELNQTILSRIGTVLTYVGVMLGGLIFPSINRKSRKVFIISTSMLPSIILMVVQGNKGSLFLCAVFFYSSILIHRLYVGDTSLTNKGTNKNILLLVVIIFPAIVSSFISRGLYGHDISFIFDKLIYYLSSYAFGHMYAFSDWFSFFIGMDHILDYTPQSDHYYGFYTFMAIFKLFGSQIEVPAGIYADYFYYRDLLKTNIFTVYRGLLLDFGLFGCLIFNFLLGAVTSFSFYFLLLSLRPYFSIALFALMCGFFYTSFIISIFVWNSIFVSFVLFGLILNLNHRILKIKFYKSSSMPISEG